MAMVAKSKNFEGNLTENLKKGLTEFLVLSCLEKRPMSIYEILKFLDVKSNGNCKITFPYALIYRLTGYGFIADDGKRISDNRLRAFYRITDEGKVYLEQMRKEYDAFSSGMSALLTFLDNEEV